MPSEQTRKTEAIAWATLDEYIKNNPKPRMSARTRHRSKMWLISYVHSNISLGGVSDDYVIPLDERNLERMLEYARNSLDD